MMLWTVSAEEDKVYLLYADTNINSILSKKTFRRDEC
jgi:hypothetical protein